MSASRVVFALSNEDVISRPTPSSSPPPARHPLARAVSRVIDVLNSVPFQTALYLIFVVLFQMLAGAMRMRQEYFLDKHVMDRLVESHFDASHNTFVSVRRIADIYEWGNQVFFPGLFGDLGPCRADGVVGSRQTAKACLDDAWPDGDGVFGLTG